MSIRARHWPYSEEGRRTGPALQSNGLTALHEYIAPPPYSPTPSGTAGLETETEDEQRRLPTSRIATPQNLATPSVLNSILPVFFFSLRLLSVVPSVTAMFVHLYHLSYPPICGPNRMDYALSMLWALLTAHQCLSLTNGLFQRWRLYYSTFPTIIRLLALQAICWPATHLTLKLFSHGKRPLICWTIVGSTTCVSKAVELWVTSNLRLRPKDKGKGWSVRQILVWVLGELGNGPEPEEIHERRTRVASRATVTRPNSTLQRTWDWKLVLKHCVAPPAAIYVLMAWVLLLYREFELNANPC